jgi:hypothetical protein
VKLNALRHGLRSIQTVVPGEDPEAWEAHRAAVIEDVKPVGALEYALAEQVAVKLWRLGRASSQTPTPSHRHIPVPCMDVFVPFGKLSNAGIQRPAEPARYTEGLGDLAIGVVAPMPDLGPTNPVRRNTRRGPESPGPQLKCEEVVVDRQILRAGGPAPYTLLDRDPSPPPPQEARLLVPVQSPLVPFGVGDRVAALLVKQDAQPLEAIGERFAAFDLDPDTHVTRLDGRREAVETTNCPGGTSNLTRNPPKSRVTLPLWTRKPTTRVRQGQAGLLR